MNQELITAVEAIKTAILQSQYQAKLRPFVNTKKIAV